MKKVKRWVGGLHYGYRFVKKADSRRKATPPGMTREDFLFARGAFIVDRLERGDRLETIAERCQCSRTLVDVQAKRHRKEIRNLASRAAGALQALLK